MSIGKITAVAVSGPARLSVGWDDGCVAQVDLTSIIARRPALAPLGDPARFASASLSEDGWSVEWPDELDFGSSQLRRWADEQAGEAMPVAAFRDWVAAHGLTADRAARALGLPLSTFDAYLSGELPVPKTVLLATLGYDQAHAA